MCFSSVMKQSDNVRRGRSQFLSITQKTLIISLCGAFKTDAGSILNPTFRVRYDRFRDVP